MCQHLGTFRGTSRLLCQHIGTFRCTSAAPHTFLLLLLLLFLLFPLLTLYPSSTRLTESASQFYIHFFDFFLKETEFKLSPH